MKITVPSYKCAKFIAFLTHLAFPFFPSRAEAQQAGVLPPRARRTRCLPAAPTPIAHTCVLFLGESCETTPGAVIWVLAMRGGGP